MALHSLSSATTITFKQLAETANAKGFIFAGVDGYLQDLSTNFAISATSVWAPLWTNTEDSVFNLVLTTNALTITTTNLLPASTVGAVYSQTLMATGGTPPYMWSVVSNSLATGLQLVATSGTITGTPSAAGTANFRVRCMDASSLYSEKDFSLTVNAPANEPLTITKLQAKLNFAKVNADSCTVKGTLYLPANYSFASKTVTLSVGDVEMPFTLGSKGSGLNGVSTFSKPTYNKKTGRWTFSAALKNGSWQSSWAEYSMINSNIPKPGVLVTNFPVILVVDTEAFMGTVTNLHYTAKWRKSGTVK
jgi:hypothetical protein